MYYSFVCICVLVYVPKEVRGYWFPVPRDPGSCELPDAGAEIKLQVLSKDSMHS